MFWFSIETFGIDSTGRHREEAVQIDNSRKMWRLPRYGCLIHVPTVIRESLKRFDSQVLTSTSGKIWGTSQALHAYKSEAPIVRVRLRRALFSRRRFSSPETLVPFVGGNRKLIKRGTTSPRIRRPFKCGRNKY